MRLLLLPTLLIALASPAHAGLRATYIDPEAKELTILVADNGDARISESARPDQYGLLLDGHFHIVGVEDGKLTVARIEDVAAAIDQVMPPIFRDIFTATSSKITSSNFRAEKTGKRTIEGREGAVWAVYGLSEGKPDEATEFVMSDDPALKPVGRAMEQFMNAAIVPAAVFIGPATRDLIADTRAIFALGTPLDAGGRFKLTRVETVDVAHEAMELPSKPVSVETLVAEMKARQGK